jgi:Tol biopolymer transport system component
VSTVIRRGRRWLSTLAALAAFACSANGPAAPASSTTRHPPPNILFDMHDTLTDSVRNGNRDVYRVALDGSGLARLTSGAGDNIEPAPSPSGASVVFTTYRNGAASLYRVTLPADVESEVPGLPTRVGDPAFSLDGTRLAFVGPTPDGIGLWTSAPDGSEVAAVPGIPTGAVVANPVWCKGGDSIVVVTTAFGDASLFLLSAASGAGRSLTDGSTHDVNPACGPDGTSVVFSSTRDGDLGLFVLSGPAGSETVRRLDASPASDGEPTWLRDGRVVFVSAVGTTAAQLAWLDPAGGPAATVIPLSGHGTPAHPRAAAP